MGCRRANAKKYHQYDLSLKLNIIESVPQLAGDRAYMLKNAGVKLNYALINYSLDFLIERGYQIVSTPHFINANTMASVCQLSDFNETLYKINNDNDNNNVDDSKFLIATSEQPMTAYFAEKTLNDLPMKLGGISSCYRKEAGKHGIDTAGIFRVHQFEKVEQFAVTECENSWDMMKYMINTAEDFYKSLGISYRIVNIVSGALNDAAAMKYDIEGWFPGSNKYRELVSCTNTTDFFSRRLRTKDKYGNFVHMLNSTLFANTRTICCIIETYQTDTGVKIPDVLVPYMKQEFISFR